jgi:hypothetical protein
VAAEVNDLGTRPRSSESSDSALTPARPGGPVLIHAAPGLGKSSLATAHPLVVVDADNFLYGAVASGFPDLDARARLRAWRELCRRLPWREGGASLDLWARVRRAWVEPFVETMRSGDAKVVVTSLLDPPWYVSAYYGIERGRYLEHLQRAARAIDNLQSEAMNDRLEGYAPLVRMSPGTYLADRPEILALL